MIPANTDEWLTARIGHLGASMMPTVMLKPNRDGSEKAAREKLRKQIVAERMTGYAVDHFVSPAMQHGLDWEDQAKLEYEAETGNLVSPAGWFYHPTLEYAGATPDGLIDVDGVLECKCPTTVTHLDYVMAGVVPEEYRPQMAFQILCTGRKYADFVSFDPRLKTKKLFIRRFEPTAEYLAEVQLAAESFLKEVDLMFKLIDG